MHVIIDTNVPVVANGKTEQASPICVESCIRTIQEIRQQHILVIDDAWKVLKEYKAKLHSEGQPGVGDAFLKWVLTHRTNPRHCEQVSLTRSPQAEDENDFCAFPDDENLMLFDRSDRKFVALALTHPATPPVYNAVDSDWWNFRHTLENHGVHIEFLCPDEMQRIRNAARADDV
jgi:hypothetical protein